MYSRFNMRLDSNAISKLAFPWINMEKRFDSKECSVCWEECKEYLLCSQHMNHCVCPKCAYSIVENSIYVNPDASIDIKWKCPLCKT